MPLKLIPPEKAPGGRYYYLRGTYLRVRVYRSTGTDRKALANAERRKVEKDIEDGRYTEPREVAPAVPTFADAAVGYLKNCGNSEVKRVQRVLEIFKDTPLSEFENRAKIDEGEEAMYPGRLANFSAGTLNREYRNVVSAVLHDAAELKLMNYVKVKRHKETQRTQWAEPDVAQRLIAEAYKVDARMKRHKDASLGALLVVAFTCNLRISEACGILPEDVNLSRREFRLEDTKNGESYTVHLGDLAFEAIANLPNLKKPGRPIFGFKDRHAVKYRLGEACAGAGLVILDKKGEVQRDKNGRVKGKTFTMHQVRHSFGTWMRRNGHDLKALQEFGRWKDPKSVFRYTHVSADEHAPAIAALPLRLSRKKVASKRKCSTKAIRKA